MVETQTERIFENKSRRRRHTLYAPRIAFACTDKQVSQKENSHIITLGHFTFVLNAEHAVLFLLFLHFILYSKLMLTKIELEFINSFIDCHFTDVPPEPLNAAK